MLNGATPVFTALLAIFLLRQVPRTIQIIGLTLGFAGITAIALPSAGSGTTQAIGVVLILIATVCYAVSINMVAPLQQSYGALPVMAKAQWIATALVTPFGIYGLLNSDFGWSSLLAMLAVGVLGTGFAFVMMGTLSGRVGATRSSFLTYLIPVVALILGVAFRNEVAEPIAVVGVMMVIVGAFLASRKEV
jgi:drug/metabolite transporter (DMT)-like permease